MRKKNSGHPIAELVIRRIESEGITLSRLAADVGISQSYLSELLLGDKPFCNLRRDSLRSLAAWLQLPAVRLFLFSGLLRREDFSVLGREQAGDVKQAMLRIAVSSYAVEAGVDASTLVGLPPAVKLLLALVFKDAVGEL